MVAAFGSTQNIYDTSIQQVLHAPLVNRKIRVNEIAIVHYELIRGLEIVISCLEVPVAEAKLLAAVLLGQRHQSLLFYVC